MSTKRLIFILLLFITANIAQAKSFPKRPIKLIVYTRPGGAIDVFTRKFQAIAKKYTNNTFVVVNKPGAGGVIALKYILKSKADGYTIAAVTKSNIGKLISSKNKRLTIDKYDWLAMLASDPEAIIVNKKSAVTSWQQILADSKAKNGKQLWVGPATGGNDHIMAIRTWNKTGIKAKWIPYAGGGKAMAALMGGHGIVYVGNPGDVLGKPSLKVAAISSKSRLPGQFSNVPTFSELGIKNFDSEIMWRGFMGKKGMPPEVINFYNDLFAKVGSDPEWIKYIEDRGARSIYYAQDKFSKIVKKDWEEFEVLLKELKII
ncbi:MAG: tripartite tricarboxylate transporter substrate binding protein [Bacteriovoracaceae bacterium]|nr:tripartite tricarboxylate transporter substrate binding protein [Bacteriovoracaceae bacterium]